MDTTPEQEKVASPQLTEGERKKIYIEEQIKVLSRPIPIRRIACNRKGNVGSK